MYKETLSLYTPNIVASHNSCIGLRKSCGIINVIWYMRSSSGSSLLIGFIDPFGTCLSYIVNKHKSMTVNTLFLMNHFLITINTTKRKYFFLKKGCKRCVGQARKVLRAYLTNWTSSVGTRTQALASQTSSTPTFTKSLPKGTWCTIVDPS